MQSVGEQLGKSGLETFRAHPALVTSDAIGVELELEGWTSTTLDEAGRALHPLWSVTGDGSLRNGGAEFITNGGLGGEKLHQAFERMTALLARVNYDASWRCSTHMHVNMLDFTVNQVARFLMVYAACEPVFFKHCGQFRRSSNFCTPVGDSLPFHKKLIARLWDDVVSTRAASQATNKYTALNLQPLFGNDRQRALGTIEFRGGRPMTELAEFVLQANLLLSIKHFVRTFEGNEEAMLTRLNDGVFNTVFANGCAAELEVPSAELDDALIHSWLLLKSYQIGMTKKPDKKAHPDYASFGQSIAGMARSLDEYVVPPPRPTAPVLDARTLDRYGYYTPFRNDGQEPQNVQDYGITREMAPKMFRYMEQLVDPRMSETERSQYLAVTLMDRELGARVLNGDEVNKFSLGWKLHKADTYLVAVPERRSTTVIPAMCRALEARAMGIKPCVIPSKRASQQPNTNFTTEPVVDYRSAVGTAAFDEILRRFNMMPVVHGNRAVFDYLAATTVHVRDTETLNQRLSQAGAIVVCPEVVPAVYLKYLLKFANTPSALVIHRDDLPVYDQIAFVVDALQAAGCTVPVYKPNQTTPNAPFGVLRCERTMDSTIGVGVSPSHARRNHNHPARRSAFSGQNVY